jgi:hypothetical protein
MNDTSASGQARYVELLRQRSPHERLAIAASLSRSVRDLAAAGIRAQRPGVSEAELGVRLAVRLYGRAVAERLFGAVPDDAR